MPCWSLINCHHEFLIFVSWALCFTVLGFLAVFPVSWWWITPYVCCNLAVLGPLTTIQRFIVLPVRNLVSCLPLPHITLNNYWLYVVCCPFNLSLLCGCGEESTWAHWEWTQHASRGHLAWYGHVGPLNISTALLFSETTILRRARRGHPHHA